MLHCNFCHRDLPSLYNHLPCKARENRKCATCHVLSGFRGFTFDLQSQRLKNRFSDFDFGEDRLDNIIEKLTRSEKLARSERFR